jgi:hypothetical protein
MEEETVLDRIDLFFEDPTVYHEPPRWYGVLYLLRRDIRTCLDIGRNAGAKTHCKALWPGAMAIMAGIDLLAKFLVGSDSVGQSGRRFRDFVGKYFEQVSSDDATTIYQLRNALLHSFGLYSEYKSENKRKVYRFTLTAAHRPLVQEWADDKYWIDILALHDRFETAIECYHADLRDDQALQRNFNAMFPKYGTIYISNPGSAWLTWLMNGMCEGERVSSFGEG